MMMSLRSILSALSMVRNVIFPTLPRSLLLRANITTTTATMDKALLVLIIMRSYTSTTPMRGLHYRHCLLGVLFACNVVRRLVELPDILERHRKHEVVFSSRYYCIVVDPFGGNHERFPRVSQATCAVYSVQARCDELLSQLDRRQDL